MGPASQHAHAVLGLRHSSPGTRPAREESHANAGDLRLARIAAAYRGFLEALGLDLGDPDLAGTDHRVARAYEELLAGLRPDA